VDCPNDAALILRWVQRLLTACDAGGHFRDQDLILLGFIREAELEVTTFQLMVDNNLAILKDAIELQRRRRG
jgi:hypothetical protein